MGNTIIPADKVLDSLGTALSALPGIRGLVCDYSLMKAQTEKECADIKKGRAYYDRKIKKIVYLDKKASTYDYKKARTEGNQFAIMEYVAEEIKNKKIEDFTIGRDSIEKETIDYFNTDFLPYWEEQISHLSREDLRQLWAKLLVKELEHPHSISRRTIQFLCTIKPKEVTMLNMIFPYVIQGKCVPCMYNILHAIDFDYLENLGLIIGNKTLTTDRWLFSTFMIVNPKKEPLTVYIMTDIAQELYSIASPENPDIQLLEEVFNADNLLPVNTALTFHKNINADSVGEGFYTYQKKAGITLDKKHDVLPRISLEKN